MRISNKTSNQNWARPHICTQKYPKGGLLGRCLWTFHHCYWENSAVRESNTKVWLYPFQFYPRKWWQWSNQKLMPSIFVIVVFVQFFLSKCLSEMSEKTKPGVVEGILTSQKLVSVLSELDLEPGCGNALLSILPPGWSCITKYRWLCFLVLLSH